MERNPKLGICPFCEDGTQNFLQTVQSESILKRLTKDGVIHRGYQYCNRCIDGAKDQVRQAIARQRAAQAQPQPQDQPQFPMYAPSGQSAPTHPPQYSPIGEVGARGAQNQFFEQSAGQVDKTLGLPVSAHDEPMHSPTTGSGDQWNADDEEMQTKRKLAKAPPK